MPEKRDAGGEGSCSDNSAQRILYASLGRFSEVCELLLNHPVKDGEEPVVCFDVFGLSEGVRVQLQEVPD